MKRWPLVVAALYAALLLVMTVPAGMLAFAPKTGVGGAVEVFAAWPYWLWLVVMLYALLFAFGPAVFFLFAERWKKLHPNPGGNRRR